MINLVNLIYYEEEIKILTNDYKKTLIEYNKLIIDNKDKSIFDENEFVEIELKKLEKLNNIEKRLLLFHTLIIKKDFNEIFHKQIKISKYKYKINSKDKNIRIIIQTIKNREEILDLNKKEGYLYISSEFNEPNIFWQSQSKKNRNKLDFEFIEKIEFQQRDEIIEEDKSISTCDEFENKSKILIGEYSKSFYENKITNIIKVCDKLYQRLNLNEEELYKLIDEIINKIKENPDFSASDNYNLMFNEAIKFNKQIKYLTEKNIKSIYNNLNDIIKLTNDYKTKYEKYNNEIEKINTINEIFKKDYSLKLINFQNINTNINLYNIKSTEFINCTPVIYFHKETGKIKCNYKNINYESNYFIYEYHDYSILNIISTLNNNVDIYLEQPIQLIKLENNILKPNSVNKIILYPPPENTQQKKYNIYQFILNVKNKEDKLSINYNIKINYEKFYVNLNCIEYELIYDEKEEIFKFKDMEYLLWGEEINIKYISENENINIVQKTGLINDKNKNTANKPNIIIDENNSSMIFIIKTNKNKEDILSFIANIYFTDSFLIKILFDTKVKENKLEFLIYDYNREQFDKTSFLYLKKDYLLFKGNFIYDQYLYLKNELEKTVHYKIEIKNKMKGIEIINNEILNSTLRKEAIFKLSLKINKDFAENLSKKNIIEIQCILGDMMQIVKLNISEIIEDEQIIKICYKQKGNEFNIIEKLPFQKIKDNDILLYNGFIKNLSFYIDYSLHKINNQTKYDISNFIIYFNLKTKKLEKIKKENFIFENNNKEEKILLYGIINEIIYWYPLMNHYTGKYVEWYSYYQLKQLNDHIDIIVRNFDNNYNNIEDDIYSFNNLIYLIKIIESKNIISIFEPLFDFLSKEEKLNITDYYNKINELTLKQKEKKIKKYKIILICELYKIYNSKYNELKNSQFNINIAKNYSNIKIKNKIESCLTEYFKLDNNVEKKYNNLINNKEKINNNNSVYLISPKEKPIKKEKSKNLKKNNDNDILNIENNECEGNDVNIENYEKIEIETLNNFDLTSCFYYRLIDEVLFLPIFLIKAKNTNNKGLIKTCNHNFNLMCEIYSLYKDENYSLLSDKINEFKKIFLQLCESLKKSGIDFNYYPIIKEDLNKLKEIKGTSFIEYKIKKINRYIENYWNNKLSREEELLLQKIKMKRMKNKDDFIELEENGQKEDTFFENENQSESEEENNKKNNNDISEKDEEMNERLNELEKIILGEQKINSELDADVDRVNNQKNNSSKKGRTKNSKEEKDEDKKLNINQDKFEEEFLDVTESDGVNRCIIKLKNMEINKIKFKNIEGHLIEKIKNKNFENLPIKNLYEKSKYISQYFMYRIIQKLNNNKISLDNKCVSILLDCSVYIKPYKKIINNFLFSLLLISINNNLENIRICLFYVQWQ